MTNVFRLLLALSLPGLLAACSGRDSGEPVRVEAPPSKPATSLEGGVCATVPETGWTGDWGQTREMRDCLRHLAYDDWAQASAEAAQVATWPAGRDGAGNGLLQQLINVLIRYQSAEAMHADLEARGLLGGAGDPESLEWLADDWQPITVNDWLMKEGRWYAFDAETGTFPNEHDYLLRSIAALFGEDLADARFTETPPEDWNSDDPYQIHATLGDRQWSRQAENYGDWYDIGAVLGLLNEIAADIGIPQRAISLETYDQTAYVTVAPGESLVAAATEGLILVPTASDSMQRGKAFEAQIRDLYGIEAE